MIINGFPSGNMFFPYVASVQKAKSHHCGGVILSNNWIITAAHCIVKGDPLQYSVRVGSHDRTKGDSYDIDLILLHENFTWGSVKPPQNMFHDLALLRTISPIKFNDRTSATKIMKTNSPDGLSVYVAAGWGRTEPGVPTLPLLLRFVNYQTLSNEDCKRKMPANAKASIYPSSMCIDTSIYYNNFCRGDSGGPLLYLNRLIGIHSWGIGCERYPDVFIRVIDYKDWIDDMQKINFMLPPNSNCVCLKMDRCRCESRGD